MSAGEPIRARAVFIRGAGGPETLFLGDLAIRAPGPGEVLVEVAAAGLNRADVLQRRGFYPAPPGVPADVPGLEYAGVVAATGADVALTAGTRVMGITGGGAMATHVVVHEREILPVPMTLTLEQAAAIPEAFLTAYDALCVQGGVGVGDAVLVHAAASGVGTAAMQLARAAGARVIGTTRSAQKRDRLAALGLDAILCSSAAGAALFADEVVRWSDGVGARVILDAVGAAYAAENIRALAIGGSIIVIGLLGGAHAQVPLAALMARRGHIVGTVLRGRPLEEKAALAQRFLRTALPLFDRGALVPVIDAVLPMSEIAAAHQRMEDNATVGKLVLRW